MFYLRVFFFLGSAKPYKFAVVDRMNEKGFERARSEPFSEERTKGNADSKSAALQATAGDAAAEGAAAGGGKSSGRGLKAGSSIWSIWSIH